MKKVLDQTKLYRYKGTLFNGKEIEDIIESAYNDLMKTKKGGQTKWVVYRMNFYLNHYMNK